jgi:hypothetical protein
MSNIHASINNWIASKVKSNLKLEIKRSYFKITGIYFIGIFYDEFSRPLEDEFEIEIIVPKNYPESLPTVKEKGKKIPKDYHMNGREFCLGVPIEMELYAKRNTIKAFLDEYLDSYLAGYMFFSKYEFMPFEERSHGVEGKIEFFQDYFSCSYNKVKEWVNVLYNGGKGRNEKCICGSNKKYKRCHLDKVNELLNNASLESIKNTCEELLNYYGKK